MLIESHYVSVIIYVMLMEIYHITGFTFCLWNYIHYINRIMLPCIQIVT